MDNVGVVAFRIEITLPLPIFMVFVALGPVPMNILPAVVLEPRPKLRFPLVCDPPISILPVVILFPNVMAVASEEGWYDVPINPPPDVIVPEPVVIRLLVTIFEKLVST
jgi:hypothetical protein